VTEGPYDKLTSKELRRNIAAYLVDDAKRQAMQAELELRRAVYARVWLAIAAAISALGSIIIGGVSLVEYFSK
jgi:hypothetical protein